MADPRFRGMKDRHANRAELEGIIRDILATRTSAEWQAILDAGDVPSGPVNDIGQALAQPIVQERGFLKEIEHPRAGRLRALASPLRFPGRFPDLPLEPPPLLGEDTAAVLRELCGTDPREIERLIEAGVIAVPAAAPARPQPIPTTQD